MLWSACATRRFGRTPGPAQRWSRSCSGRGVSGSPGWRGSSGGGLPAQYRTEVWWMATFVQNRSASMRPLALEHFGIHVLSGSSFNSHVSLLCGHNTDGCELDAGSRSASVDVWWVVVCFPISQVHSFASVGLRMQMTLHALAL